ncbi:MAG: hypothetical protein JWM16_4257 [Verrucomicrobiales bacterium]|nr:hypothetical protein [Verrucomicrobiales bacterium]
MLHLEFVFIEFSDFCRLSGYGESLTDQEIPPPGDGVVKAIDLNRFTTPSSSSGKFPPFPWPGGQTSPDWLLDKLIIETTIGRASLNSQVRCQPLPLPLLLSDAAPCLWKSIFKYALLFTGNTVRERRFLKRKGREAKRGAKTRPSNHQNTSS